MSGFWGRIVCALVGHHSFPPTSTRRDGQVKCRRCPVLRHR